MHQSRRSTKARGPCSAYISPTTDHGLEVYAKDATTVSAVFTDGAGLAAAADFVPTTLAITAWQPLDAAAATILADRGICWVRDLVGAAKVALVTFASTLGARVQWDIPATGATRQAVTTYVADSSATGVEVNVSAHTIGVSATGAWQILYTQPGAAARDNLTRTVIRSQAGVLSPAATIARSMTLVSRTWRAPTGEFFVVMALASAFQGNSYVLQIDSAFTVAPSHSLGPAPQAQFAIGSSGALDWTVSTVTPTVGHTSAMIAGPTANSFITAIQYLQRIPGNADGTAPANRFAIELATITHLSATQSSVGPPVEIADSLIVPGGTIGQYDGYTYHAMGFAYAPEGGVITTSGVPGGLTTGAAYWYVFVYSYLDAQGRLWRSAPSTPMSVVLTAGTTSTSVLAPTLRINGFPTTIEIYRGAANSTALFQKVGQVDNDVLADTAAAYADGIGDLALASGEDIYTTGDPSILPNETIPGSPFVFTFQDRIWFISGDDPTELWFSDVISPKNGPRFSSQNVVRIADSHGPVYAAGVMDDKVVALKEDAVYSWNGDGPDGAGNGGYTPATIVALGVGTTQPRSVLSVPDGVIFKSSAARPGMQMINRALALARAPAAPGTVGGPFGEAVLRYSAETISSAMLVPEQSQARFYCYSGTVLVYDLVTSTWTTSLLGATQVVSAVNTGNGALVAATNGALLLIEDPTGATYADNGVSYIARVGTPWIQVDGIAGFQRLMELIGAGRTIAAHTLTVDMYLDFDDTNIAGTKTFSMTVGTAAKWNWQWVPRIQRMSAVRFVVSETSAAAGFQCEGITALLGLKQKLARQPTFTRG